MSIVELRSARPGGPSVVSQLVEHEAQVRNPWYVLPFVTGALDRATLRQTSVVLRGAEVPPGLVKT